jgi:hypothetical protein
MDLHIDSINRKELTMKRLTTTLATVSLVLAVVAPIASASKSPAAKVSYKASQKQSLRPYKQELVWGYQVHIAKKMSAHSV